ncbi:chromate transporter [Bacteroidia bacterium]|nr:chromate transporter [Bacteroidia bacterium]
MVYLQLIGVFFQIGIFGFGGGYAMLSLIQHEVVVRYAWITSTEFANIVAISQVTPGPISINCATYIGYAVTQSVWGAAATTLALVLPSFVVMLSICAFLAKFQSNRYVKAALAGIRPVVVGLIAAAALMLMNVDNFQSYKSVLIFAIGFVALWKWKLHPLLLIALAGGAGILLF